MGRHLDYGDIQAMGLLDAVRGTVVAREGYDDVGHFAAEHFAISDWTGPPTVCPPIRAIREAGDAVGRSPSRS
jgi:hypothetical protein